MDRCARRREPIAVSANGAPRASSLVVPHAVAMKCPLDGCITAIPPLPALDKVQESATILREVNDGSLFKEIAVKKITLKHQTSSSNALRNLPAQEIKLVHGGGNSIDIGAVIVDTGKNHRRH
jgi:hypothetical protein